MPRSALESGTVADPRMERITRAIFASKYSIHDLSRCKGKGDEHLARFNMPLELGIAMARRYAATKRTGRHDWLVLVPKQHAYARFVSDLAGFDVPGYDGSVQSLTEKVVAWLVTRPDAVRALTPKDVLDALPTFVKQKESLKEKWGAGNVPWADIVIAALNTA